MQIIHHLEINKDLKKLKRFQTPKESLEAWERLFYSKNIKEMPGIKPYPGFGQNKVFKAKVIPLRENCGKSNGYRLVFRILDNDLYEILIFSRHEIYKSERDLIKIIKIRL